MSKRIYLSDTASRFKRGKPDDPLSAGFMNKLHAFYLELLAYLQYSPSDYHLLASLKWAPQRKRVDGDGSNDEVIEEISINSHRTESSIDMLKNRWSAHINPRGTRVNE